MSGISKGLGTVEVALRWDPSPLGSPAHDLDVVAAVHSARAPYGPPAYRVYFDSRSPDGTVHLDRDSRTGQGLGYDEVMTLELDRMPAEHGRVVIGVVIQQGAGRRVFGEVANPGVRIREGYTELSHHDLSTVADATAATVAEFTRTESGAWHFREDIRGFTLDPDAFIAAMGAAPSR
ncbi:TerD family protein [Streptomyces sp. NPDC048416]|uniref:TerD family protein n=1 Tax=Streptomyces sp. NPDC048416 TaxID=3365546 RepID=UPI0037135E2C